MASKPNGHQSLQEKKERREDLNKIDISVLPDTADSDVGDNLSWRTGELFDNSRNGSIDGLLSDEEDNVVSCLDELSNSSCEGSIQGLPNDSVQSQPTVGFDEASSDAFDAEETQSIWSNTTIGSMDTNTSDMSDDQGAPKYMIFIIIYPFGFLMVVISFRK